MTKQLYLVVSQTDRKFSFRIVFVVCAFANLVFGLLTGLGRLGLAMPMQELYIHHGAIMTGGFLGSLIALEKAIPLRTKYFRMVPLISACSIVVFYAGHFMAGVVLLIVASVGLMAIYMVYLRRQCDLYLFLMLIGAGCWCTGNVMLLAKRFYPMAFPWWMAFVLFTIVSERLELSKFLPVTRKHKMLLMVALGVFLAGLIIPFHGSGAYISGAALILVSLWLMRYDIVGINIGKKGLTRYTGCALLCGYVALLLDGIFMIAFPDVPYAYDAVVHTFFLGFVFSMIFAHGPIILPGVLGLPVKPFHPFLYVPLAVLIFSLGMRILADAGLLQVHFRMISGWLSAGSIILYFLTLLTVTTRSVRHAKSRRADPAMI